MTELLIRLFVGKNASADDPRTRTSYGVLSGFVGIAVNVILTAAKFAVGSLTGSISITADAINNLSDAGSSVVTLVGFKMAKKPADREHPYGHGRIEYISALIVSFLVLLMGVELLKSSVEKIKAPDAVTYSTAALAVLIISKFSSVPVDGWFGLVVSGFIIYSGIGIIKDTVSPLLGQPPKKEFVKQIEDEILSYPNIVGVHDLIIHDYGPGRQFASAHAEVPSSVDVMKSHDTIDLIERNIQRKYNLLISIHLDPIVVNDAHINRLRDLTESAVKEIDPALSIHDFRVVEGPTHSNLIFDVMAPPDFRLSDRELTNSIQEKLSKIDERYFSVITVDHSFN